MKLPVLTELSLQRLGQLSMALEIHERRSFHLHRDHGQLLDLLNAAVDSINVNVSLRLCNFIATLSAEHHHQLVLSGARLHTYGGIHRHELATAAAC